MPNASRTIAAVTATAVLAMPAIAQQASLTARVSVASNMMFRGVSWSDAVQYVPGATLAVPHGAWSMGVSAWASGEIGTAAGTRSLNPTLRTAAFTGYFADLGVTREARLAAVTLGVTGQKFPRHSGNAVMTSSEVYALVSAHVPLAPTFGVYRDLAAVRGTYMDLTLSQRVPVAGLPVMLGAQSGVSLSQGLTTQPLSNFGRNGLVFGALSASTTRHLLGVDATPQITVQRNVDPWARARGASMDGSTGTQRWRVWFQMSVARSQAFGARR
jgi:hypothetical protein